MVLHVSLAKFHNQRFTLIITIADQMSNVLLCCF